MTLPTSGPYSVPLPPISTDVRNETDNAKTKVSLLMKPFWWAKKTPPSPAYTELITKASTFHRYTLTPTLCAAISLPRKASSVRPTREPSRLLASSWQSSATPAMSQKYCVGDISSPSGNVGAGMAEMPIGPLVRLCQRFVVTSIMKPKASVTIARYGPFARNDGMASSAPATPATATPSGALTQNGQPARVASSADV